MAMSSLGSLGLGRERSQRAVGGGEESEKSHLTPTTPSTTRFSPVIVPVLSKQQMSTRPAKGMRKGSVQKMAASTTSQLCSSVMEPARLTELG